MVVGRVRRASAVLSFVRRARVRASNRLSGRVEAVGQPSGAYDNAVCEAFFEALESELIDRRSWPTKAEARLAVFDFIETFSNRRRRHSTLGYLSPAEYERSRPWNKERRAR
ncbi:MAG TPA: IS3 family transposase [Actinomycetota bacterium]|jgi:putative transposase|nr:IS3 family transposase [Actinomycetota bacterium]